MEVGEAELWHSRPYMTPASPTPRGLDICSLCCLLKHRSHGDSGEAAPGGVNPGSVGLRLECVLCPGRGRWRLQRPDSRELAQQGLIALDGASAVSSAFGPFVLNSGLGQCHCSLSPFLGCFLRLPASTRLLTCLQSPGSHVPGERQVGLGLAQKGQGANAQDTSCGLSRDL